MTGFLLATLLALLAVGGLVIVWREHRAYFWRAVASVAAAALLAGNYAWWVTHGYELLGDSATVSLSGLRFQPVAGSIRVSGEVRNNSDAQAVSALPLTLRVDNCTPAGSSACTLFAELDQALVISIPPGETRNFVAIFNTPPLPSGGTGLRVQVGHGAPRTHRAVAR